MNFLHRLKYLVSTPMEVKLFGLITPQTKDGLRKVGLISKFQILVQIKLKIFQQKDKAKTIDDLKKPGYTFPIKLENQDFIPSDNGIVEATHAPTGCMLIKRTVLESMIKHYPELEIFQPTIINGAEEKKDNMYNLFATLHDPKTKRYLGEDFAFCRLWSEIGGKLYCYIMSYFTHVGEYQYKGRLYDEMHDQGVESPIESE